MCPRLENAGAEDVNCPYAPSDALGAFCRVIYSSAPLNLNKDA